MINAPIVMLALILPMMGHQWGKRRRAAGKPVTLHDAFLVSCVAWAVGWPTATLPAVFGSPIIPLADRLIVTSIVLATAVAPLAVDWLIRLTLRLVRRLEAAA